MIRTFNASTFEVDDAGAAVEQIKSQIEAQGRLLANTIGIVACHNEFVISGVLKAVCEAFPFETVGTISPSQSAAGETGALLLTLMVMTSDDVKFVRTITPSLMTEPGKVIAKSYLSAKRAEKPALILVFAPYIPQNSGDEYVEVLTEISQGAPCFGTLAVEETTDFLNCYMLADGEHYRDRMAMVMLYGNVRPRFYVANISESKRFEKSAVVTKSAGPVLMEVNERPVIEYFEDLGLVKAAETQYALSSLPFLLDYNDGSPLVSKIFVMLTPEKYALCAGSLPQGSTMYTASADRDDVLLTTGEALDKILKDVADASGLLVYTCISRSMTLAAEQFREMELVREKLGDRVTGMMVCSGGEICPTMVSNGRAFNRFHNNAFIACLF